MNRKRVLSLALALGLCLGLALPAGAASEPEKSDNYAKQNYQKWAFPVNSYLYENSKGGLTRVEYVNDHVVVEDYDSDFHFLSGRTVQPELELWGGFYAGKDYNFLVWGQNNEEESDSKEVVRVVKYDKDWNRLGAASLKGANTYHPFDAGSLRCSEYNGFLFVHTCHEMYTSSDGLNHQANLTFSVNQSTMEIADSAYKVSNTTYGYVSHSFNQFILTPRDGIMITVDQGDAYPRSGVLFFRMAATSLGRFTESPAMSREFVQYPGSIGDNTTGGTIGGLVETTDSYLVAYTSDGQGGGGNRLPYLGVYTKATNNMSRQSLWNAPPTEIDFCPPFLVPTGKDGGYVLWAAANTGVNTGMTWYYVNPDGSQTPYTPATEHGDDILYYTTYTSVGGVKEVMTAENAPLSDCQPIVYNGKVTWYVTNQSAPTFYTLDSSGVTAHPAAQADLEPTPTPTPAPTPSFEPAPMPTREDIPVSGTAYQSTQKVDLDGVNITLPVYALKDANGYDTNYIRLRDMADLLNGTQAQFDVLWSQDTGISAVSHHPYDHPNDTELDIPFSGNQPYTAYLSDTYVDGAALPLTAFQLFHEGGGHTYYKLRDLGMALGFNVGWTRERGMFIETDRPYTGAD